MYSIMEICRLFDQIYKEHLDGVYVLCFVCFLASDQLDFVVHFYILSIYLCKQFDLIYSLLFAADLVVIKFTMFSITSFLLL